MVFHERDYRVHGVQLVIQRVADHFLTGRLNIVFERFDGGVRSIPVVPWHYAFSFIRVTLTAFFQKAPKYSRCSHSVTSPATGCSAAHHASNRDTSLSFSFVRHVLSGVPSSSVALLLARNASSASCSDLGSAGYAARFAGVPPVSPSRPA